MQLDELLPYCNHRPDGDIEAPSFTTPWSLSLPKMSYSDCCPYRFVSHFEIHVNRSIQYIFSSIARFIHVVFNSRLFFIIAVQCSTVDRPWFICPFCSCWTFVSGFSLLQINIKLMSFGGLYSGSQCILILNFNVL